MDIRVAIFEDNPIMSDAYQAILNGTNGYHCVGAFREGSDWEKAVRRSQPEVVLMDIDIPGLDGISVTKKIKQHYPAIKVLVQTIFQDDDKVFAALCAGANGYITKDASPSKMMEAITDVFHGGAAFTPFIAARVTGLFRQYAPAVAGEDYELTRREKEILQLLAEGFSMPAIAERIFLSYETVRSYVKSIYQKLHVASATQAVAKAIKEGLV